MPKPVRTALSGKVVKESVSRRIGGIAGPVDVKAVDDMRIKNDGIGWRAHARSLPQDSLDQANTPHGLRISATEKI